MSGIAYSVEWGLGGEVSRLCKNNIHLSQHGMIAQGMN
jgi:hypothetical protein